MCYLIINIEAKASSLIKHVQILLYTGFFVLEYQINVTLGYVNRTIYSKYMLKMFYRCEQWVINSRREDLIIKPWPDETWEQAVQRMNRNKFLCGNHFEESQFMNATLKNSLIWSAVPTIFDIPNKPKPITPKRKAPNRQLHNPKQKKQNIDLQQNDMNNNSQQSAHQKNAPKGNTYYLTHLHN